MTLSIVMNAPMSEFGRRGERIWSLACWPWLRLWEGGILAEETRFEYLIGLNGKISLSGSRNLWVAFDICCLGIR